MSFVIFMGVKFRIFGHLPIIIYLFFALFSHCHQNNKSLFVSFFVQGLKGFWLLPADSKTLLALKNFPSEAVGPLDENFSTRATKFLSDVEMSTEVLSASVTCRSLSAFVLVTCSAGRLSGRSMSSSTSSSTWNRKH